MKLRDYQQRTIDQLYDWFARGNQGNPCLVLPTGCHAAGAKVIMFDGSTKAVEDVLPGDILLGPDSLPRHVMNLCRGTDAMYLITPKKGEPFVVNGNHILALKTTNEGKKWKSCTVAGNVEHISVADYMNKTKSWAHLRKLYRAGPLEFSKKAEPILDPWAIGVLLGDGSIINTVSICNPDKEILDGMAAIMSRHGLHAVYYERPHNPALNVRYVDDMASRSTQNRVMEILRTIGIAGHRAGDKFIPDFLKTGSVKTRLNILAGLLDTDGHYDGKGFDYISKSKRLANDVTFVCRSLGLWAKVSECKKYCQTGNGGTYWRVGIYGDLDIIPTRVARKQAAERKQKKNHLVTGFSVEYIGDDNFYGFTLTGDHLYMTDDFIVHHNSGKSVIIAALCRDALQQWPETRVLMLTHVKELIEQNYARMLAVWPNAPVGIYSASIGRKQAGEPITFAGIQSVRTKASEIGHVDLVIVDECHTISHKDEGGYRTLINALTEINPHLRVVGLTATPWRLGHGRICDGGALFSDLIEPVSIEELLYLKHLAPLHSKRTDFKLSTAGVHKRGGEYIEAELQEAMDTHKNNCETVAEIIRRAGDRKAWLIFCTGVKHAEHIAEELAINGIAAACITGSTPKAERERLLDEFKAGRIRAMTNANVLTTGFDYPDIDLIAFLRPTMSPSLYVQMAGRGLRPKSHTDHCLVLDFAGNVETHGPITNVREPKKAGEKPGEAPMKVCPECQELVAISARNCPACGHEFPPPEEKVWKLSNADIMRDETPVKTMAVTSWKFSPHTSYTSGKDMIRITYYGALSDKPIHEYMAIFHEGYAGEKAARTLTSICNSAGIERDSEDWRGWCDYATENGTPPASIDYTVDGKFAKVTKRIWE